MAKLMAIANETAPAIESLRPEVPPALAALVHQLMEKQRDRRPATPRDVAASLLPFCSGSDLRALAARVLSREDTRKVDESLRDSKRSGHGVTGLLSPTPDAPTGPFEATVLTTTQILRPANRAAWKSRWLFAVPLLLLVGVTVWLIKPRDPADKNEATSQPPVGNTVNPTAGERPSFAIAPFTADEAQKQQAAWAKYLGVPVEYTNSIGMKFRLIPPGEFSMGSAPHEIEAALKGAGEDKFWQERIKSEFPKHNVVLTQPTYLSVYEVTQTQYEKVMEKNPSHFAPMGVGKNVVVGINTNSHPVEMVNWNDAAEFCATLSQQDELKPFYIRSGATWTRPSDGTGYCLPTEAEWEFACRAGTTALIWNGDQGEDLIRAS